MLLVSRHDLKIARDSTNAALMTTLLDAFAGVGEPEPQAWFRLEDNPTLKASAIGKLVRADPSFAPFVLEPEGPGLGREATRPRMTAEGFVDRVRPAFEAAGVRVADDALAEAGAAFEAASRSAAMLTWAQMGTLDRSVTPLPAAAAIPLRRIAAVVADVPRIYKCGLLSVLVREPLFTAAPFDVDRWQHAAPCHRPGLVLQYHATMMKLPSLQISIEHAWDGASATPPPPVDPRALSFTKALGATRAGWAFIPSTRDELATSERIRDVAQRWGREAHDVVGTLPLPHALPAQPGSVGAGSALTSPHKAALVETFVPHGYKYASKGSGHGTYALTKRTASRNALFVTCDTGAILHRASFMLGVQSATWQVAFEVPVAAGQVQRQYPIDGSDGWARIVANAAVVVAHLERHLVPEIEAIGGSPPAWWTPT